MKNPALLLILFLIISCSRNSENVIGIDASKKLHQASEKLFGANVEDLNFQGYGGMYSQLLYGQDFEEFIDVDFLDLPTEEPNVRSMVGAVRYVTFVVLDENSKPYLTTTALGWGLNPIGGNPVCKHYELDSKKVVPTYWFDSNRNGARVPQATTTAGAGRQGGNNNFVICS